MSKGVVGVKMGLPLITIPYCVRFVPAQYTYQAENDSPLRNTKHCFVLSSSEAGCIPLTQELKLTVSEKDRGCHRQCLALDV